MFLTMELEALLQHLAVLPRECCLEALSDVPLLQLDFTDAYLATQSTEQVRHLLLAALLQARRRTHERRADELGRPAA